jgi:hypothetical protein
MLFGRQREGDLLRVSTFAAGEGLDAWRIVGYAGEASAVLFARLCDDAVLERQRRTAAVLFANEEPAGAFDDE